MDETTNTNNTNKEKFKIKWQEFKNGALIRYKYSITRSKFFVPGILLIAAILIIIVGIKIFASSNASGQNVQISTLKKENINKNFDFPILDDKGKEVGKISYEILSTELDKNILVQGKFATAVSGKLFLVVNIKLTNNQDKGISINTKDYLRLSVNGDFNELLAPSLHNDPVTVQPISIQYSRLGFIVADTDKNPVLRVGEIKGTKTDLKINF